MRDPARIKPTVRALERLWNRYPDWRLGQLIMNVNPDGHLAGADPWQVEDDRWLVAIEAAIPCDYCSYNKPDPDGYHRIGDEEGIEGISKIPCPRKIG